MRNSVERSFGYLEERIIVFHHKLSARDYVKRVITQTTPYPIHNILLSRKNSKLVKILIWTIP